VKKRLKINGVIMACAALVIVLFPRVFLRVYSGDPWEEAIEASGFGLILLGQIIRVSARGYKAEHSQDSQVLIQGGPYQIVRNPMYLGIFLIGLGVVMAVFRLWAAGVFIAVFIIRYILLIYKEEKKLLVSFPEIYPEYCQKTPRLFPSLANLVALDLGEYLPIRIVWFKKEIGSILTLFLLTLLIESWEDISKVGLVAYFKQSVWIFLTLILFSIMVILLSRRTSGRNENETAQS